MLHKFEIVECIATNMTFKVAIVYHEVHMKGNECGIRLPCYQETVLWITSHVEGYCGISRVDMKVCKHSMSQRIVQGLFWVRLSQWGRHLNETSSLINWLSPYPELSLIVYLICCLYLLFNTGWTISKHNENQKTMGMSKNCNTVKYWKSCHIIS